jgi:xanthine dehydrogenase accessory factor
VTHPSTPSPASAGEGRRVWVRAIELSAQGLPYAIATVVRAARPASCRPGDRAIIHPDGRLEGWVGGSCAQPTVVAEALAALRDGDSRLVAVTPHHDFPAREGMAVHPMTCISGGEIEVFVEPVLPPPQLIVCGASPVAAALVAIGSASGFEVVAVDPDASIERFPTAAFAITSLEVTEGSPLASPRERHVVAATHGQWDEAAIEGALRLSPRYVGLVASRTRYDATIADLIAAGIDPAHLGAVRSRPGIDLGAKTPLEVALGIVAEIVAFRRTPSSDGDRRENRGGVRGDTLSVPAESSEGSLVEDPICGMMVDPRSTMHWLEHDGKTWHYCNARCRRVHARQLGVALPEQANRSATE